MVDWLSAKVLAPEVHASIGFGVILAFYLKVLPFGLKYFAIAIIAFAVVVFLKESTWDPVNETEQPLFWEGMKDLGGYALGAVLAVLLILL